MNQIYVCPLSALEDTLAASGARSMISLMGPGKSQPKPGEFNGMFLAMEFNDIAEPQDRLIAPDDIHIQRLIDFFDHWNQEHQLLIHCWMGISRSTAAALIAMAAMDRDRDMMHLAQLLRARSAAATPNPLMVSIADRLLELDGRLTAAVRSIGRGEDAFEGTPFFLEAYP